MSPAASQYSIFVMGGGTSIYYRSYGASSWDAWVGLGGGVTSSPAVSRGSASAMEVVVIGTDRAVYHQTWNGKT